MVAISLWRKHPTSFFLSYWNSYFNWTLLSLNLKLLLIPQIPKGPLFQAWSQSIGAIGSGRDQWKEVRPLTTTLDPRPFLSPLLLDCHEVISFLSSQCPVLQQLPKQQGPLQPWSWSLEAVSCSTALPIQVGQFRYVVTEMQSWRAGVVFALVGCSTRSSYSWPAATGHCSYWPSFPLLTCQGPEKSCCPSLYKTHFK